MTVIIHPQAGTVVRVDLSEGFRPPEMIKRRPAIVLSPQLVGRNQLCTIVPLSTTPPNHVRDYHCEITFNPPLPRPYDNPIMWVKADIVLTVAFHRLRLLSAGKVNGQRQYDVRVLDQATLDQVKQCVKHGLGL